MRFLIKFRFPAEAGNKKMRDPEFMHQFRQLLSDIKAEAAYLTPVNGERGGYVVVDFDDAAKIAAIAEHFYFWLSAQVEFFPVMLPEDFARADPDIRDAQNKWML